MSSEPASELLSIGQQCSAPNCSLVDFLPIKCSHCTLPYCSDHYQPTIHKCTKFDPTKHDRIAPACPFCNTPVAFAAGADPNLAMEKHFEEKCEVVKGGGLVGMKSKTGRGASEPRCARNRCNKLLVTPIPCGSCRQLFCPEHRFPNTHTCVSTTSQATALPNAKSATPSTSTSRAPASISKPATEALNAKSQAGLAAMKRAAAVATNKASPKPKPSSGPAASNSPSSSSQPSSSIPNPFGKTERWESSSSLQPSTIEPSSPSSLVPTAAPSTPKPENGAPHTSISSPLRIISRSFIPPPLFAAA